jgi:putative oxidoreductase
VASFASIRDDLGKLILRVTVAGLMLFHGVHKLGHGISGIVANVDAKGLPHVFAYGVYIGEVIAPLFVIAGFYTRPAALVITFNMIVATALSHAAQVFSLGAAGQWAIELQLLYGLGGVAIALLGPGRFSASRGRTKCD